MGVVGSVRVVLRERLTKNGRRARDHRLYDHRTFQIIDRVVQPDDNCVDVGCHEGLILSRILQRSPRGHHYAFEPLPHLAQQLRERFPQVDVREVALATEPGTSEFVHVTSNPGYSGLKERRYDRPHEELTHISVEVDTLDRIIPPDVAIRFVKIDVEGAELGVLEGGIETIHRCRPHIVFEHGLGASDYYGTRPHDIYDLLVDECALEVSLLERWLHRQKPLGRDEFAHQFDTGENYYFIASPAGP